MYFIRMLFVCKWKVLPLCLPFLCMLMTQFVHLCECIFGLCSNVDSGKSVFRFGVKSQWKYVERLLANWRTDLNRIDNAMQFIVSIRICVFALDCFHTFFFLSCMSLLIDSCQVESEFKLSVRKIFIELIRLIWWRLTFCFFSVLAYRAFFTTSSSKAFGAISFVKRRAIQENVYEFLSTSLSGTAYS